MSKDILYYPTIEFQPLDYEWLWVSALLFDKVYRIVPEGYTLNEPRNIQELCSTGEIGIPIAPDSYSKKASDIFLRKLSLKSWEAAALEFNYEDIREYERYCRLHKGKVDVTLRNLMLLSSDISENKEWLHVPKAMANQYMIYLATEIVSQNNLSLHTGYRDVWTASTFFLNDGAVEAIFSHGKGYQESKAALVPVYISNIIPYNILDITPYDLLKFREKRKDERQRFNETLDNFCEKLSSVTDRRILKQIWYDEIKELEYALSDYKKSMDILKVVEWTGYLSSLITIATDALGYVAMGSNIVRALTSAGIGLGLLTGLAEKKIKPHHTKYSYLSQMKKLMPSNFNNCNYVLYRKMEEFLND